MGHLEATPPPSPFVRDVAHEAKGQLAWPVTAAVSAGTGGSGTSGSTLSPPSTTTTVASRTTATSGKAASPYAWTPGAVTPSPTTPTTNLLAEMLPPAHGVCRIRTVGRDEVGCPSCNVSNVRLEWHDKPPGELRDIFMPNEWRSFSRQYAEAMHETSCGNHIPCFFPCWLLCRGGSESARQARLDALLSTENFRLGQEGLQWQETNTTKSLAKRDQWYGQPYRTTLTMTWMPGVREAWEAAHPNRRKISREPYPLQLLSATQQEAQRTSVLLLQQQTPQFDEMAAALASSPDSLSPPAPSSQRMDPGTGTPIMSPISTSAVTLPIDAPTLVMPAPAVGPASTSQVAVIAAPIPRQPNTPIQIGPRRICPSCGITQRTTGDGATCMACGQLQ